MRGLHQIIKSNEEAARLFEQQKALEELAQIDRELGLDNWIQGAQSKEQFNTKEDK